MSIRENLKNMVAEFPVGCKVGKASLYTSNIFDTVSFAYVVGYETDDDGDLWLLVYHERWDGHSGHDGVLTYNLQEYKQGELEKKYGEHCWWIESKDAKRV